MPTILRQDGFRFYFFSNENQEPPHVHIDKNNCTMKIWLHDNTIACTIGYNTKEINKLIKITSKNNLLLERAWHEHFSN